jgi:ubiquinone/menaquinone biosynthesis C-methylase UbiE
MSVQKWRDIIQNFAGRGTCPHQLSSTLDLPLRRLVLSPEELAQRLHLDAASQVLEVGCGPGYFSVEVAQRVPQGRLELFDLQREMLEKARRKLDRAGVGHIGFTQGDARRLPFTAGCFDVAFLVTVLGEVPDPAACLRGLYRLLRPGGWLSITEQPGDPDFQPLPVVRTLAEQQGFTFIEAYRRRWRHYTVNFTKSGGV